MTTTVPGVSGGDSFITTPTRRDTAQKSKLQLRFTEQQVVRLTGLIDATVRHWVKRGWVVPCGTEQGSGKNGRQRYYSAWQLCMFAAISATQASIREKKRSQLGRATIIKVMEAVRDLDDALLLAPTDQDQVDTSGHLAEQAAKIVSDVLPEGDLPQEAYTIIQRCVRAIDHKWRGHRETSPRYANQLARRVAGPQ